MDINMSFLTSSVKTKRLSLYFVGCLVLYAALGFFVLPGVLLDRLPKLVQQELGRDVRISEIEFNPFFMEMHLQGLEIMGADAKPVIGFEQLRLDLALIRSLFNFSVVLDQVFLDKPYLLVSRNKQGTFNVSLLFSGDKAENHNDSANKAIFPLKVDRITFSQGMVDWEDALGEGLQTERIYPINLQLENFSTQINQNSQLGLSLFLSSGGTLEWKGNIAFNPLASQGHIALNKVNLPKVWQLFLQDSVNFVVTEGTEEISAEYNFFENPAGKQLIVENASLELLNLKLAEKDSLNNIATLPNLSASGISFDLLKKSVIIEKLTASDAGLKSWINRDGSANYQSLLTAGDKDATNSSEADDDKESTWQVRVNRLAFNRLAMDFDDYRSTQAFHLGLKPMDLLVTNLTNIAGENLAVNLNMGVNKTGVLAVNGNVAVDPLVCNLQVDAKDIAIKDFQPYVAQVAKLDVMSGAVAMNGQFVIETEDDSSLAMHLMGGGKITDLSTRHRDEDFINWKSLELSGMNLDFSGGRYQIDKVRLEEPYSRVAIGKDKSININDILIKSQANAKEQVSRQQDAKKQIEYRIDEIDMVGGVSDFKDNSLIQPFSTHISQLTGSVKNLSSDSGSVADIKLTGKIAQTSPVKIYGTLNPGLSNAQINLGFTGITLPSLSPYMIEFAGRKIEKGNMSLDLNYRVQDHRLASTNNLLINQLMLGERVPNPNATSLPLELAIALLEDGNGKITLDIPVSGSLNDPEFSLAGIVVDALVNVVTKTVASPFSTIASVFGNEEDISHIDFDVGKAELGPSEQEKLDTLAIALKGRPRLNLEIQGTAFYQLDWPGLQKEALDALLLQNRADGMTKQTGNKVQAKNLPLTDKEYRRLLADLFIDKYPSLAERTLFGEPRLLKPQTGDFYQVAKTKLASDLPPDDHRLHKLAEKRAQAIADYLIGKEVAIDRLFLLQTTLVKKNKLEKPASSLALSVQ